MKTTQKEIKKILLAILCLLAGFCFPCYAASSQSNDLNGVGQVVLVTVSSKTSSDATVVAYESTKEGKWVTKKKSSGRVGKAGIEPIKSRKQSTNKTPQGIMKLLEAYGKKANPGTKFVYHPITEDMYWNLNSKSSTYNQLVRKNPGGDYEHLIDYNTYNYMFTTDYNMEQIAGKGGAIFFHCNGKGATAGCVSVPEQTMKWYMTWLDPSKKPVLIVTTTKEVQEYFVPATKIKSITAPNDSSLKLTWERVYGTAKYDIQRASSEKGTYTTIQTITDPDTVTWTDTSIVSGKKYYYRIKTANYIDGSRKYSGTSAVGCGLALTNPQLAEVSNAEKGITVKWNAVKNAVKYRVFRKTDSTSWTKVGDTSSISFTDTTAGLKSGTTYIYTVRCISSDSKNYTSGYDSTGKRLIYLKSPSTEVTNAASGVLIKWGKVSGAGGYYVYRKKGSGKYSKIAAITSGSTVSYTDTAVKSKSGTTYTYAVRAANGTTLSSYTGQTVVRLSEPSVTVSNAASGVTIKWDKISGAKGYYVYRKTGSGNYSKIKNITSGSTVSYTDTAVKSKNGTAYTYAVRAYNGSTRSSYTGKAMVRLSAPAISGVSNSKGKKMTVKWNKNKSATGYQVKYKTGSNSKTVTVKGASSLSTVISGLTKGKKYTVCVRAYKTVNKVNYYSAWSASKTLNISR